MKKFSKILVALALVAAMVISFAACSGNKGEAEPGSTKTDESTTAAAFDSAAALQSILDNFKADEQYAEYKAMFQSTTFEEKVEGNSIILNISGDEGVSGNYEFKLDGDYLTYTQKTDSEDYVGYSFFMYLKSAADKYLGMDSNLTTGYVSGCEAFGIENKYFITQTDKAAGTTTKKLYIAGKWDMPEIDTMYVNDKALEYTEPLNEDDINGVINCGKIRVVYYGNKDSVDIIVSEYGKRSDLTYQSIINTVKKLQPTNISVFEKYFTELKEGEDDGVKVTFGLDESLKAEHELEVIDGAEYTVIHFGA